MHIVYYFEKSGHSSQLGHTGCYALLPKVLYSKMFEIKVVEHRFVLMPVKKKILCAV